MTATESNLTRSARILAFLAKYRGAGVFAGLDVDAAAVDAPPPAGDPDEFVRDLEALGPTFIKIGQALGAEKFYDYLEDFGFLEKTGIDMLGEQDYSSLIWPRDKFTGVDLAVASFGQRFQVTPIQLITAASAVINGGHLMQPYVVSQVTDGEGNVLQHNEPNEVRQVGSAHWSAR